MNFLKWKGLLNRVLFSKRSMPICCIFKCKYFSFPTHFSYRAPYFYVRNSFSASFLFLTLFFSFKKKKNRGKLTIDSLNLGRSLISLSIIQFKRWLLAYKWLENRTWLHSEIINFLSQTFFSVTDLWLEEQVYSAPPSPHECLLHQKYPITLNLFTEAQCGGVGGLVSAEIREWSWRNPMVFFLSIIALGQHP